MKIVLDYSNQHRNIVVGDPNPAPGSTTEEMIAHIRALGAKACLEKHGHTVLITHICGTGTASEDELVRALDAGFALKPDFVLSFHSDAGGRQDVYPLVSRLSDVAWGTEVGKRVASLVGMPWQAARDRHGDLAIMRRAYNQLPGHLAVLLEIGVHGYNSLIYGMPGPVALWKYAWFHGYMVALGFLQVCGLTKVGVVDTIPADVAVPAGYEKYYQGGTFPQGPVTSTKVFEVTDAMRDPNLRVPFMCDPLVGGIQQFLNRHYPAGTKFQRKDGTVRTLPIAVDNKYGFDTEGAEALFESEHYWLGKHLVVDWKVGPEDLAKMRSLGL